MSQLRWGLCDSLGRLIAPIDQPAQDNLQLTVNDIRNGSVTVSIEDPVVPLVESMATRLKAWLNGHIVLNAPIFLPDHAFSAASESGTLTISATDNLRLATGFLIGFAEQLSVDQSEILARIVEAVDATPAEKSNGVLGHGIIRGVLASSVLRDRTYYDLTNAWQAMVDMSQVIDGPDFDLQPLDREDGIFAQLDTHYPKLGSDLSGAVLLEYGVGAENATGFGWQPSGEQLCNRFIMAGATPEESLTTPAYIAENVDSQRLFGIYAATEVDTEISEMATLKERADGVVGTRAFPLDFFSVQPALMEDGKVEVEYGVPPRFGPPTDPDADFWLGDTIGALAQEGALSKALTGRVVAAVLSTADKAGNVAVNVTLSPPDKAAGGTGREVALILGPPNQTAGSEATVETDDPPMPEEEPEPPVFEEETFDLSEPPTPHRTPGFIHNDTIRNPSQPKRRR